MTDEKGHASESLIEFRLTKLEDAVSKLSELSSVIIKWDARFSESGNFPLQCGLHRERLESFDKRLSAVEDAMESVKSYMNRAIGAIVIITAVIQLVGPMVLDHFKEHVQPTVVQSDSSGGFWRTNAP